MMKYFLLFLFFIVSSCANNKEVIHTPLIAYISLDKEKITIGDTVNITISINKDKNIKENTSNIKKAFKDFLIYSENKSYKYIDNRVINEFKYKLQAIKIGKFIIEPIEINYTVPDNLKNIFGKNSIARTSKISIEVESNLTKEDKNKDIEDIKSIRKITYLSSNIIIIFFICLFIAIIIIYLLFRRFYYKDKKTPYYKKALIELEKIDFNNLKLAYFEISNIVRKFIDDEFNLNTLEKTTEEIENYILKIEIINKEKFIYLLKKIDIYKFTELESSKEELQVFTKEIIEFIKMNLKKNAK